eukprot:CAMPEP_0178964752 /NCGR_PEP_ID=MMETSP0789-20121207/15863_1 /TAXON_ID=3005 /ORGANISM="Rhizosolenia setigera, Strain CCMP 1694" /LENGTH=360 /DNA_ID=CAMNT_0020649585 /DNA_START=262 /DNA_END=1344 /DNA_ORIENTATION=+
MFSESNNFTFPTVEERIEIYMGSWYDRDSILINHNESIQDAVCEKLYGFNLQAGKSANKDVLYNVAGLEAEVTKRKKHWSARSYHCQALAIMNTLTNENSNITLPKDENWRDQVFIILNYGDSSTKSNLPVVSKTRGISAESIIWPFNMQRHFKPVDEYRALERRGLGIPWEEKDSRLVWRGSPTGTNKRMGKFKKGPRVQAVTTNFHYDEKDIDVAFDKGSKSYPQFTKCKLSMRQQLRYKYILSIEGNDISSGLKWQLASNSVVFMAKPTVVSYAMEHMLVPFLHYIPLNDDYSNLMEMVEWARANDEKCRWISQQATEYMNRLYGTEQADHDNELIAMELAKRYFTHFSPTLKECAP